MFGRRKSRLNILKIQTITHKSPLSSFLSSLTDTLGRIFSNASTASASAPEPLESPAIPEDDNYENYPVAMGKLDS
jgi:hypothetical protein